MVQPPCLPTLTERPPPVPREAIEPWPIWEMKRLGALEPGFTDEFESQDCLGRTVCKIETLSGAMVIKIGGHVQVVSITYTTCGKGGRRHWWTCPGCGTRRGVIYLRTRTWGCRGCLKLPYRSQRMSRYDRAVVRAKQLHVLLGGTGSLRDELPSERPHGMRRRSYFVQHTRLLGLLTLINELLCQKLERLYGTNGPPLADGRWPWSESVASTRRAPASVGFTN
jgi:hypothetical protein